MDKKRLIFSLLFFLFVFLFFLRPVSGDGDFYHHLATGREIVANHVFPFTDKWTFTAPGGSWIAHSWGMGVVFYLVFSVAGLPGISILVALIGLITILLLFFLLKSLSVGNKEAFSVLLLSLAPIATRFPTRPEIITYPLVLILLLFSRNSFRWVYPVVIFLWANLYGANVLLGVGLVIFMLLKSLKLLKLLKSTMLIGLTIGVAFLNPNGSKTVFYFLLMQRIAPLQGEWAGILTLLDKAPPDLLVTWQYQILVYFLYLFFYILLVFMSWKRLLQYRMLFFLSLGIFMPFFSFRQVPLAVILSIPFMGRLLSDIKGGAGKLFFTVLLIITGISLGINFYISSSEGRMDNGGFPDSVVKFIEDKKINGKILNNQRFGAYLSYYLYPDNLVYVDTRDELFLTTSVFADYFRVIGNNRNVKELLTKYGVDLAVSDYLSEGKSYQPLFYDKNWKIVYLSDRYLIAVPISTFDSLKLKAVESIDPFSETGAKPGKETEAEKEMEEIVRADSSNGNLLLYARILLANKKYDSLIVQMEKMDVSFGPGGDLLGQGRDRFLFEAYLGKGECGKAFYHLDRYERNTRGKFIFNPKQKFPSVANKAYAFYYLQCIKDVGKGRKYLDLYVRQPEVLEVEKMKTRERFEKNNRLPKVDRDNN